MSLQGRFLAILGASSMVIAALIWLAFNNFTEQLLERIGARFAVEQSLFDRARPLQPVMLEMALVKKAAKNPTLGKWATDESSPALYRKSMSDLRQHFSNTNFFVAIAKSRNFYYYEAAKHHRVQPLRYQLDPSAPDDKWIFDFLASGDNHSVQVLSNKKLRTIKLWSMVAIREGGRIVGVLGTGINLYEFTRNVSNIHLPGVTNMFIDRDADIQIYNDVSHFDFPHVPNLSEPEHLHTRILGETEGVDWLHRTMNKLDAAPGDVETEFVHINGKRYLAGLNAIPELGWYDLTLLDLSVLLPRAEHVKMVLALTAGAMGLLAILAYSLQKLVLTPVASLTDAVSRIRKGDYSAAPPPESVGEVGELASQVHHMAGAIHNNQQRLESEIDKRNERLRNARELLEIALQHERNGRETQANLMALMAHEMRSPVAVISNTAQMLNMLAKNDNPSLLPRIEKIMRSVRELASLMDNFLTEKWLDMDKQGLNRQEGDLNVICLQAKEKFVESHDRPVRLEPLGGDARTCADWQLIGIAVLNLLDNADKYSSRGSEIRLKIIGAPQQDALCIEVTDQGVGIPPDLQAHLFEKFARGRHAADIQGSGLGLYLVNWIARFHGGTTGVTSIEGVGTTFRLCLPICRQESDVEQAARNG